MNSETINESKIIYILKAFAIFSIVCAHCSSIPEGFSSANMIASSLVSSVGALGVSVFFLLAGYFFGRNKRSFWEFFKNKIFTLFIPWLFCGIVVYLYVYLRKGGLSVTGLLQWLLGNGSYLYYMTVLTACYLIYFCFIKAKWFLYLTAIVSVISNILTSLNLYAAIGIPVNPYLNILNWVFLLFRPVDSNAQQIPFARSPKQTVCRRAFSFNHSCLYCHHCF